MAIAVIFAGVWLSLPASAAINSQINFQGKLTNTDGTNVTNGSYSIEFNIYSVSSGGVSVWTETQGSVAVSDGIFRVALGSVSALPGSVDFNSNSLYLGIKVGADPEMSPRVQFTAAPYAFNTDALDGIDSTGFAQLGLTSAQVEASTNALIFLNKTSTGNLLQLQQGGTDRFLVNNSGILTTASVNSGSIVDGTVANGDLVSSSVSVIAGDGLVDGGAVSLGGSVTLNIGAGTGITVAANTVGVTADGLNFTELSDTLSLDATTTISLGANNLTTNLSGTGDFVVQFGGNTVLQILDTGAVSIGNALADQTIGIDNGTGAINIATDSDANATNIGTGTAADTVTIGDSNADVAVTDAQWSISGAGAASFASMTGSGLADCDQTDDTLKWDSTTGQFSCGTNRGTFHNTLNGNFTHTGTGFVDVDNNADATDELGFVVGANETWVFDASLQLQSNTTADAKIQVTAPAGATCDISVANVENSLSVSNLACTTSTGLIPVTDANFNEINVRGSVAIAGTAGTVMVQFGQNTSSGTSTIASGSFITAFRISGADYAEIFYAEEQMQKGMIAQIAGGGPSQVRKSDTPYSDKLIGIYSTQPGNVVGENDGTGQPVPIALSGRVPIKLSTENGLPQAGDMITASSILPGYGMLANRSGYIVGQMMMDATDNGDGTADGYVYVRHGYWQAPFTIDLSVFLGEDTTPISNPASDNEEFGALSLEPVAISNTYDSFDQRAIDTIIQGFSIHQDAISTLQTRLENLEQGVYPADIFMNLINMSDSGISFLSDVRFSKNVWFDSQVTFAPNSAGLLKIPVGTKEVTVSFEQPRSVTPKILVSPNTFIEGSWRVTDISEDGFTFELSSEQAQEIEITWQSVQTQ